MNLVEKFSSCILDLTEFEQAYAKAPSEDNVHGLEVLRVELDYLWTQVRRRYEDCRDAKEVAEKEAEMKKVREQYRKGRELYKNCLSSINAEIEAVNPPKSPLEKDERISTSINTTTVPSKRSFSTRLPPIQIDTFCGDYAKWPTFRDFFAASVVRNDDLHNIDRLFQLLTATGGEAREIVENAPLTNNGFEIAWKNLLDRFENTRMQVNEQLKILFNLPNVTTDSAASLKALQRTVNGSIQSLTSLSVEVKHWDPILTYLCSSKLPQKFLEEFENSLPDSSALPTWDELDKFMTQKFKTLESVANIKQNVSKPNQNRSDDRKSNPKDRRIKSFHTNISQKPTNHKTTVNQHTENRTQSQQSETICQHCKANHRLWKCPSFKNASINDRLHIVQMTRSCYNCLSMDHGLKDCQSTFNCRHCNLRHNSLLHKGSDVNSRHNGGHQNQFVNNRQQRRNDTRPSYGAHPEQTCFQTNIATGSNDAHSSTSVQNQPRNIQSTHQIEQRSVTTLNLREETRQTLLHTALVQIESDGQRYDARAIIDNGSQSTFISEKLTKSLKLPTRHNTVHVSGLSQSTAETSTKACLFTLRSRLDPSFKLEVWAQVLKNLPSKLPTQTIDSIHLSEAKTLDLADPLFNVSRSVDLLIGLDLGPFIYSFENPMKSIGSLVAQDTVFGWIVGGPISDTCQPKNTISLCNTTTIDKILTQFWVVEETPKRILRSSEDILCETIYRGTTTRHSSGRYIVTQPFKNLQEIGNSRNIAMAHFLRMEKILSSKPELKTQYDNVILEYLELGHMKKANRSEINKLPNYYLPHHAIIKPEKVTSKIRVVFNASCPTSNKKSLNDILHTGPILQQDLVIQTLKWRFFKYVFNADITKMYRQILVEPNQTQYQRILFRKSKDDPIEDYELLTVTFGVNCAPFLAIRTLLQLAEDVNESFPLASKILQNNMYVDDVLAGGHTIDDTIKARKEITEALKSAGFELAKWTANYPKLIEDIPHESLLSVDCLELAETLGTKTLGIKWWISSDQFSFPAPKVELKAAYTKREVLSTIAKFFDPCGWLAPIILTAKLIMQQVWLDKVDWDDTLKPLTIINWQNFVKNCPLIETITIPRWIHYTPWSNIEAHGFADSSEKSYSACLYIRLTEREHVHTFLLTAKTRVAPIKKLTLPRLELCGAVLLSKLADSILPNLGLAETKAYFWTDSTIVLAWLKKPSTTWNTFVGNRVAEITEKVGVNNWRHIDSRDNPADVASRGCSPNDLKNHNLWWHGPTWLKLPKHQWPMAKQQADTNLEAKPIKVLATTVYADPLERFSSLSRAYRIMAFIYRFYKNARNHSPSPRILITRATPENVPELTSDEIKFAQTRLIVLTQQHHFPEEYKILLKKERISPSSNLLPFNPFIDSSGVVRANGRLVQSPALTYAERHPILLPHHSRLTRLLVEHIHKITLHGGNQLMTRVLRSEFWIVRLTPLVKNVIHKCKICILFKKHQQTQIMASLPPERTTLSRPFTHTGVDFAGPFDIRNFTGRACLITKGYVCIFVCFATKAIHLEPTSDLSTQAFLAAFARFIGRRGCPNTIHSDNGTNFVGAAELLKKDRLEFMKSIQTSLIHQYNHQHLDWRFIPPGAPNMGGLWEAGVKSFKTHLRKSIPEMKFTFEELATVLAKIESCLNSRPLSPASDDPSDLSPLTPGHFLIGTSLLTHAEPDLSTENSTLLNRWKRLKAIHHNFCQRFKSEYLTELHRRYKWKYQQENLKVDDLVVLKDISLSPNDWKMGRITKIYPGSDTNTRVIDIKTINGIIRRPISKIVKLFSSQ